MRVTGERIVTRRGGFNASWQRHSACYKLAEPYLNKGSGPVVDLGCGTGHAFHHLGDRRTVGIDIDHACLTAQGRQTAVADIRRLPLRSASFDAALCIHAVEHIPEADAVLIETARVLRSGGVAVFVTPNRLTFGRPDEIIDPYHYVEYDPAELRNLCNRYFAEVEILGLFGSERYMEFYRAERVQLDSLLKKDPLRLRRFLPRPVRQRLYDWKLARSRQSSGGPAESLSLEDFYLSKANLSESLDVFSVCRTPLVQAGIP